MPEQVTKHTPGPWVWQSFDGGKTLFLGTPYRGRLVVMDFARLGMQRGGVRFARRSSGDEGGRMEMATLENVESFPDARLIAASPALLQACEAALIFLDQAGNLHDGPYSSRAPAPSDFRHHATQLRAAIAKAAGREGGEK